MLKIKELLKKQYDLFKEKYQNVCNELLSIKEEMDNAYKIDCDAFWKTIDRLSTEQERKINEKNRIIKKLNKINEILNNEEHIISLKREQLDKFSKGKIILEVGTSAIGNSNTNINGKLSGGMSGSSFLGFGNLDGSIDGYIKGNSNSYYEEYILVKYKYNLDYEIEEFLFNVDDYLEEK